VQKSLRKFWWHQEIQTYACQCSSSAIGIEPGTVGRDANTQQVQPYDQLSNTPYCPCFNSSVRRTPRLSSCCVEASKSEPNWANAATSRYCANSSFMLPATCNPLVLRQYIIYHYSTFFPSSLSQKIIRSVLLSSDICKASST
jgi:hypothetical protein